ncbi:MAG: efflux RND transporter periplasmic adaptor subunit [Parvularculaceae bacterium]
MTMPKMNRWRIILLTAVVITGGLFLLSATREKKPEYETATITKSDIEVSISEAGKVQPKNYVDVGAQVSGQLQKYYFEIGDHVEKGDLLAQIDPTLAQTKLEADTAQLDQLKASYAQEQASFDLAKAEAARAEMLMKGEAISVAEYQSAIATLKVEKARLQQWTAQIKRQQSTIESDNVSLGYTKIYAPMSGTIVSRTALEGQTLNANQVTPTILRIADLSVMTVEAQVSEADVLRVKSGQEAYFTTLGGTRQWKTKVRQVLPQPDVVNDVVLYNALMDISNKDGALMPEMTAQVFFVEGRANAAVLAPVAALKDGPVRGRQPNGGAREGAGPFSAQASEPPASGARARRSEEGPPGEFVKRREEMRAILKDNPDAERKMVLVMENGKPRPQPVIVGLKNRTQAEILYGLNAGDVVVTGVKQSSNVTAGNSRNDRRMRPPGGFRGGRRSR